MQMTGQCRPMLYLVAYFIVLVRLGDTVFCPPDSASLAIFLLQPSVEDLRLLSSSYRLWQFATAADLLVSLATNMTTEDMGLLFLVDSHLPPASLLDAVEAMTISQKTRTVQLALKGQYYEMERIVEGLIFTLSKDDQVFSRNFIQLLSTARCLSEGLTRSSAAVPLSLSRRRRPIQ